MKSKLIGSQSIFNVISGIIIGVIVVGILLLIPFVVCSLWNWIIPDLLGWGTLSYWKALGLMVLIGLITSFFRKS